MDTLVNSALEEICAHGQSGVPLSKLWSKLQPSISSQGLKLCHNVKKVLWYKILQIPGLNFVSNDSICYNSHHDFIRSVEHCERIGLNIVAAKHICDCFIGIYDIDASDAKLSDNERRTLDCLALLRGNVITQTDLGKKFKLKAKDMGYILNKLESRGLIVRQSTLVREKVMAGEEDFKSAPVSTNIVYLSRYANNLGSQQRLEITNLVDSEINEKHVNNFLLPLQAICDKLEKADGKVLAISDIKLDLGYRWNSGHKAWRSVPSFPLNLEKLLEAQVVEILEVEGKKAKFLHLLKGFSPKHFESKSRARGCDDLDTETALEKVNRCHISEMLLELPLEHQIYDMIDAEGDRGLSITEVFRSLGISSKQHYSRLFGITKRFGIHMEQELKNKAKGYRLWMPGNRNPGASNITLSKPSVDPLNDSGCTLFGTDLEFQGNPVLPRQDVVASVHEGNGLATSKNGNTGIEQNVSDGFVLDEKDESGPFCLSNSLDSTIMVSNTTSDAEQQIVSAASLNFEPVETPTHAVPTPPRRQSDPRYPCLTFDAACARREQWILQLLQEEKFLIRRELYRQLKSVEKEKRTTTDRKTLDRCLNKLSQGGHCKLIVAYVPVLTNCNRSQKIHVVLHPSVSSVSPEQIHERFRSFEMQIRAESSSQLKKGEPTPQLNDLPRSHKSLKLDNQAERSEAMRANGFVLAKMVRTKLLHIYLWEYVNSLPGCGDVLSSFKHGHDLNNPHSTCKLIDLNAALKAMPLELFLQVVGSTQKFEDMIEKCRNGVCLSDLAPQKYKCLMDIQATNRLSSLIHILRRLKLIRLVYSGHPENTAKLPHTTLTNALELKPYIEEPVSSEASSHFLHCPDLRPQIRHDFVLSSSKAVEEYWNTLEYCYSASDRKAAVHAFPGCSVNEVFLFRSWASVRVMTSEQRAELLKRVINDGPHRKLSFKECGEIAKDLSLTLEQVLRVYHDKRQQRLTRYGRASDAGKDKVQPQQGTPMLSPKKRKRPVKWKSSKHAEAGTECGLPHQTLGQIVNEEESPFLPTILQHTSGLEGYHVGDVAAEESELPEDDGLGNIFLAKCTLSGVKPARRGKFCWTDDADRQLVIEYARHRAALGAKFNRVDWGKLPNLPAPPDACRRRMALLRSSLEFRKSVMSLCNLLSQRYVEYLGKFRDKTLKHEGHQAMQCECFKHASYEAMAFNNTEPWDNFDDADIKMALDDALLYIKSAKTETAKEVQPTFDKFLDVNTDERQVSYGPQSVLPVSGGQYVANFPGKTKDSGTPLSSNGIPQKYVKLTVGGVPIDKRLYESVAVANAAELFKLIFLCSSKSPLVPTLLAKTLRRYSEHDLLAAFNYLRDKKVLIGGNANSPFVLSPTFLHCICFSRFPINTGKRAAKLASWICEREKELIAEGVDLPMDLQCGDVFHLCALLSSEELSIAPRLPNEGVGEVEDSRLSKRKYDDSESPDSDRSKKLKTSMAGEGDICSRRAKGFPGIQLCLRRATITMDSLNTPTPSVEEHQTITTSNADHGSVSFDSDDHVNELHDSGVPYVAVSSTESPWEAMTTYVKHVYSDSSCLEQNSSVHPEIFRSVYSVIQMAGDQGLCIKDIAKVLTVQEKKLTEAVVEVLEAFGQVLKVNAYDSIRVVDSSYRSKFLLTPVDGIHQDATLSPFGDSQATMDEEPSSIDNRKDYKGVELQKEMSGSSDKVHKITILNLPKAAAEPSSEKQTINKAQGCLRTEASSSIRNQPEESYELHSTSLHLRRPILPWLNGDGTTNEHVYKGLIRRVLGIMMQNPGIQEDDIFKQMHVLNPQSCRSLLNMMVLDNDVFVRKIPQTKPAEAPAILGSLLGSLLKKSQLILKEHFFANPSSTHLL